MIKVLLLVLGSFCRYEHFLMLSACPHPQISSALSSLRDPLEIFIQGIMFPCPLFSQLVAPNFPAATWLTPDQVAGTWAVA